MNPTNPSNQPTPLSQSRKVRLRNFEFSVILFVIVTGGFRRKAVLVCGDYFRYPTTTYVTIESTTQYTIPPQIAIKIQYGADVGWVVKDYFTKFDWHTQLVNGFIRKPYRDIGSDSGTDLIKVTETC